MKRVSARQRQGQHFKPNSQSIKAWQRQLKNYGRAPVKIKNPERYLNSQRRAV